MILHNPTDQFLIKEILKINLFGLDLSITNSTVFMFIALILIIGYLYLALGKAVSIVPSRIQVSIEMIYEIIESMVEKNIGTNNRQFTPLIFSLFIFIMVCNMLGMIPYGFTVTSHISITFVLALIVFLSITFYGFYKHGLRFLSLFLPHGVPSWLAPLMIIIELFTYLARPISLSLRLMANMMAGHILLKVMAGFAAALAIYLKFLPIPIIVVLIGFEIFVAVLQAYIFAILSCVYLSDAVNLH